MKNKKLSIPKIILITLICIAAITMVIVNKTSESKYNQTIAASSKTYNPSEETKITQLETGKKQLEQKKIKKKKGIPKLIDLGADKCVPCKMMAPVLEELKNQYQGKLDVEFIDVWKNPEAGDRYRIRLIPTQIFLDENGNELYRHEGFMSKQDILNKWNELGYRLEE
ncbi:MAG TPA: thioredoxin family protein [bacterium]|nr:thioredoxin family protein [bacterium]HOL35253.1 thioredoxin family protein [bacterium]HPP08712.1 thioredoxin family protein [bacterium]